MYKVSIDSETFFVPDEVSYKQYYKINKLFSELKVKSSDFANIEDNNGLEFTFKIGSVLKTLFDTGKIPEFFATILIPEGQKKWDESVMLSSDTLEVMENLTDTQMIGIAEDFLSGRGSLIGSILNSLEILMKKNGLSEPKLKSEKKELVEN